MVASLADPNMPAMVETIIPESRRDFKDPFLSSSSSIGGPRNSVRPLPPSYGTVRPHNIHRPTLIEAAGMRFIIMDAPRQNNLHLYIKDCSRQKVTDVVRVCEPTYDGRDLRNAGMYLHEMAYDDGTSPPQEIINGWLDLVAMRFKKKRRLSTSAGIISGGATRAGEGGAVAVHCIAGLGRAPVLVAIALIEFGRYDPVHAVTFIRQHRRGAINGKQLAYLEQYSRASQATSCGCVIS